MKHFQKNGYKSIFFGRFIPIIRSFISIPAGLSKMDIRLFLLLTWIGSFIWNTIFVIAGFILQDNWDTLANFFDKYSFFIFLIAIILYIIIKRHKSKKIITVS